MPLYQLGKGTLKLQPNDVLFIVIQFSFVVWYADLSFRDIYDVYMPLVGRVA